jgi:hypothetical protein
MEKGNEINLSGLNRNPNIPPLEININDDSDLNISGFINRIFKIIGTFFIILFQKIPVIIWYFIKNSPKILNSPIFAAIIIIGFGYIIVKLSKKVNISSINFYMINDSFDKNSSILYKKGADRAAIDNSIKMNYISSVESNVSKIEYSQIFSKVEKVIEVSILPFNDFINNFFETFEKGNGINNDDKLYKGFENAINKKEYIIKEFKEIYASLFELIDNIPNVNEVSQIISFHCILNTKIFNENVNFDINVDSVNQSMKFSEVPENIDKTLLGSIYNIMENNQKESHWIDPETFAISLRNPKTFLGVIYFKIKRIINKKTLEIFNQLIKRFNDGEKIDAILIELSNAEISDHIKEFVKLNKYKKTPVIMAYGLYIEKPISMEPLNISETLLKSENIQEKTYLHFVGTKITNVCDLISDTMTNYFKGNIPELNKAFDNFKTSSQKISNQELSNKSKNIIIFIPEMDKTSNDQYINPIKARIENEWPGSNIIVNNKIKLTMQPYEVIGIISKTLQENSYISGIISLIQQYNEHIIETINNINNQLTTNLPIFILGFDEFVKISIETGKIYAAFDFQEENTGYMAVTLCSHIVSGKQFYNQINLNTGPGVQISKFSL